MYYHLTDKRINVSKIKELEFTKFTSEKCHNFDEKNMFIYLIGYSINKRSNLEIKLTNNKLILFKLTKYFITLFFLFIIIKLYRINFKDTYIYICSIISSLLLVFIRDINIFLGLRYFRGGADGIAHYSWGRDILKNFSEYNFIESLKGGEGVFYYMPGLRYFGSINNLIFGETLFGYLIICTFIPLIFFKIFELLVSKKIALIFFLSFIFLPILENMGLGHFNFIWNLARFHAEPLSIFLFLLSLFLIFKINIYDIDIKENKNIYFIGLLFALSIFVRPNYFPASLIIFSYFILLVFKNGNYKILFINLIGYSFIFVCLIHNIYFGNEAFLFTRSSVNFKIDIFEFFNALYSILIIDFDNENLKILISQFKIWNPLYNLHRLIMILYILFMFIKIKQPVFNYVLFISIICQHGLLILTHPGGRYAYFAWILTFLLFLIIFFQPKKDNLKYVT